MSWKEKWKHAFSLEPDGVSPADQLPAILEKFAISVTAKKLETPAILFLEMMRPLNFIGSQFTYAVLPMAGLFADERELEEVARALEHRSAIDHLVERIEQLSGRRQ